MKKLIAVGVLTSILMVGYAPQAQAVGPLLHAIADAIRHVIHSTPKTPHTIPKPVPAPPPASSIAGVAAGTARNIHVPGVAGVVATLGGSTVLISGFSDLAQGVESTIYILKELGYGIVPEETLERNPQAVRDDIKDSITSEKAYEVRYCPDKTGEKRVVGPDIEICPYDAKTFQKPQKGELLKFEPKDPIKMAQ